jgi:peptidoglycan L-alanyl-D-glutamate endopeptidase CwlK
MPEFGAKSKERLLTCDDKLQQLFNEVIKHYDCTVVCGHRGKDDQEQAVREGKSKVAFPNSKHNKLPSKAADVVPFPIDWNDKIRFYHFAGYVLGVAKTLGIKVRWGGDWNSNLNFKDEKFMDLPHFELVEGDSNADSE